MLKVIKNKTNSKSKSTKLKLVYNKPFRVVREDGTIIHQFDDLYNASVFSTKLNISYNKNGITDKSKVIKIKL